MTELQICAVLFLFFNTITDIKVKKISLKAAVLFLAIRMVAFLWQISGTGETSQAVISEMLAGLIPGLVLYIIGKISRGALGKGDAVIVMVIGLYIGLIPTVTMVMWAFFLAFFWSGVLLILRKCRRNYRFPFVPFLFLGLVINLWMQGA